MQSVPDNNMSHLSGFEYLWQIFSFASDPQMAQRQSLCIVYLVTWTIGQNGIRKQTELKATQSEQQILQKKMSPTTNLSETGSSFCFSHKKLKNLKLYWYL